MGGLIDSVVKSLKPRDKPYKQTDGGSLYVLVSVAGSKTWKFNFRLGGKQCVYTIGKYPEVSLAEARERCHEARKLVKQGINPAQNEKDHATKTMLDMSTTFWGLAQEWIESRKPKWSATYLKQVETTMRRYVGPGTDFGQRPVKLIATAEVTALLQSVANRKEIRAGERKLRAPNLATILRSWIGGVFRLAVITGRADRNPVGDLRVGDIIVRSPVKNNRALTEPELRKLIILLRGFQGQRSTGIAIDMLMRTFVRTSELRGAMWHEFDLDKKRWVIPAARMKVKTSGDHVVPLSNQVVALLEELRTLPNQDGVRLFPNSRRSGDVMSATTINRAIERMGLGGRGTIGFSAHGFRGTASTLLSEKNYADNWIEVQLAHHEKNLTKKAYNQAKYLEQRTKMMQEYSDYLDSLG